MAVDGGSPALAIRSSVGIELWSSLGAKLPFEHNSGLPREETKNSRSISFSPDGRYFAYSNGIEVKVLSTSNWELKCTLPRPKAFYLKFSTRGNCLCTWELYVVNKEKPEGSPNMFVYEIESGKEVFAIVQKHQTDWEPSWSSDETLFAMIVGGEALFYDLSEGLEGFQKASRKIGGSRGGVLSIGPGTCPPFLAFYTPGAKGAASMCKLYKYPALGQNQSVACKGFVQADRVEILWNNRGSGLLLLTSTEVDKSGASYYGNQGLHFMATKGDSFNVPLSKKGPVHCVKWSPKAKEFVVVYGYMPSKAALYNLKCDVIFDFDEGPRNCAYFNPFGNILVLAGFGNLPGNVEIWDIAKKEKIANIKCPDTTHFEWNPNGEYFLTATTAPRLRIGNGFKVYHYSGALMHETIWPQGQELLGVEWQKFPEKTFAEPVVTKAKQEGIKSSQPEASQKAYTPPHLRLIKEGKNPEKYLPQPKATSSRVSAGQNPANQNNNPKKQNAEQHSSTKVYKLNKQSKKKSNSVVGTVSENLVGNSAINLGGDDLNNIVMHNSEGNIISQSNGSFPLNNIPQSQQQIRNKQINNHHQQQQQQQQQQIMNQQQPNQQSSQQNQQNQPQHQHGQQQKKNTKHNHQNQLMQNSSNGGGGSSSGSVSAGHDNHQAVLSQQQTNQQYIQHQQKSSSSSSKRSLQSDKEKKIRNIAKKLSDIKKLKVRQEQGETLELNQLQKIAMEEKFLNEFKALKLNE